MPDTLTPVYWTADMARRLPDDGNRYEVVYGELLVTSAPPALAPAARRPAARRPREVSLSPSAPRHDRFTKRRRYQEAQVPLYWIVDGDTRQVEIWTPQDAFPRIERDRLIWQPEGAGAAFSLSLEELFRPIE